MTRRIFIAADIDVQMQDMIHEYASGMFPDVRAVRITAARNLHITMKFLGNTGEERIQAIKDAIGGTIRDSSSLSYDLEGCAGAFPHPGRARIIFLGLKKGRKELQEISGALEDTLSIIGIKREEREFIPHITIARIRRPFDTRKIISAPLPACDIQPRIESFSLYESILGRQGPKYINIARFVLK